MLFRFCNPPFRDLGLNLADLLIVCHFIRLSISKYRRKRVHPGN